ncbi:MAG: nicotinamide-nucleotide adenylyltransferase [Nanoarchaeota archaeon]|nr:nicotinamide-nucleotide adenylyltransferase [Nanoarchaeota archaeon]
MTTGLYIVRGQPLHNGHLNMIRDKIQKECDDIIIAVGSAEEGFTKRNPLYGGERVRIFNKLLSEELEKPFRVYPVPDLKMPHKYARYVEALLPSFDVVYANPETTSLFVQKGYKAGIPQNHIRELSATSIREKIWKDDETWKIDVHPIVLEELIKMDAVNRIRRIMGGGIGKVDPEAAEFVFNLGIPITALPTHIAKKSILK